MQVSNRACFGAGCYWGTEKYFRQEFCKIHSNAVTNGFVGFIGPSDAPKNPTYKDVCSGQTGHVEVYRFDFEGGSEMYENLVRYFFQFHDPTTMNKVCVFICLTLKNYRLLVHNVCIYIARK